MIYVIVTHVSRLPVLAIVVSSRSVSQMLCVRQSVTGKDVNLNLASKNVPVVPDTAPAYRQLLWMADLLPPYADVYSDVSTGNGASLRFA